MADLTTAPCQKKLGKKGRMCYTRIFDVVLLVGLTELKAQIAWTDSETVSTRGVLSFPPRFLIFAMCGSRGRRKGSKYRFQSP